MRRVAALVVVLFVGSAAPVSANQVLKFTLHAEGASCYAVPTDLGVATFSGVVYDGFFTDATLDVWSDDPSATEPVLTRDYSLDPTIVFGPGTVTMSIPLLPAGVAAVEGTLTPSETYSSDWAYRNGNTWARLHRHGTYFTFSGTLALPGLSGPVAFGPDGCLGVDDYADYFENAAHSTVTTYIDQTHFGWCSAENAAGAVAYAFLELDATGFLALEGGAQDAGGALVVYSGGGTLDAGGAVSFDTFEFNLTIGEPTTGSASFTVLDQGQRFRDKFRLRQHIELARGSLIDVSGTLQTSFGSFHIESCTLAMIDYRVIITPSNGPKPGGRAPANDLPSGAIAVHGGDRVTLATKGAQVSGEAICHLHSIFGDFDILPQYTVWYTIAGTGSSVTVDATASDFLAWACVYADGPDASAQVAVGASTDGPVTFDTELGSTYWVQLGGDNYDVPYGTLKLAIR